MTEKFYKNVRNVFGAHMNYKGMNYRGVPLVNEF